MLGLRRTFFLPPEAAFAFASFDFSAAMLCDDVELQPGQPTSIVEEVDLGKHNPAGTGGGGYVLEAPRGAAGGGW